MWLVLSEPSDFVQNSSTLIAAIKILFFNWNRKLAETFLLNDFVLEFKACPTYMQETSKKTLIVGRVEDGSTKSRFQNFPLSDPIWQFQTSHIKFVVLRSRCHTFGHKSLSLLSNSDKMNARNVLEIHCVMFNPIGDKDNRNLVSSKPQNNCRCCLQLTFPTLLWLLPSTHHIPEIFLVLIVF